MDKQNSNRGQQGDSSAFDEWDAVFADPDPTRVLSADTPQKAAADGGSSADSAQDAGTGISATRYQAVPEPVVEPVAERVEKPVVAAAVPQTTQQARGTQRTEASSYIPAATSAPVVEDEPVNPILAYRRIQFIPSIIAVLAAYTTGKGMVYLGQVFAELFSMKVYGTPTAAVVDLFNGATSAQALPWTIILAVAYFCAFTVAGYTAARMSAIAPVKQALGVTLVTLLGILLTSLLTWISSATGGSLTPTFSLGYFLGENMATGALTLLAFFALVLLGALTGAGIGSRYHKKLNRISA